MDAQTHDDEALMIHGTDKTVLELDRFSALDAKTLELRLADLLPDMPIQMRTDLLPLLHGNLYHIAQVREQARRYERVLDVEQGEWMICLERGFDFLHTPNVTLIIGPYSPDLANPLRKAAGIIENNIKAGCISDDGFLLLASVPYDETGVDRTRAELKSHFLSRFAADVLRNEFGALAAKMTTHTTVLDWHSRSLKQIDD